LFLYGGDDIRTCAGRGIDVEVGVMDGSACAMTVFVGKGVGVFACGVTGNAVGTGPIGLIVFFR